MSLPGGPTDKLGNRYELWWTVSQLVRMLHGGAESIRIEDPGVTKAEFVIVSRGCRELHQAKRSHPGGKWNLASLGGPAVQLLQAIHAQLRGNGDRFVFVSGSDAAELKELSDRAKSAESVAEFEAQFLDAKVQQDNLARLKWYWGTDDTAAVYEVLRRIEVRTIDERGLEDQVKWGVSALFLADPELVCAELRTIAEDSIHQTVTREVLIERLRQRGFTLRRLVKLEAAPAVINDVTERYFTLARKKLIRGALIPRATTQTLVEHLTNDTGLGDCVVTGKAGVGKTGCIVELVETLRARHIPVLAFRLDRLNPVSTTTELGRQLGLEESPVLVLAAATSGQEAVLIVDQLDAVSTTSGRSSDFVDAIEGLLTEARGLRSRVKLRVVVVCRAFDWQNDHRLRQLLSKQPVEFKVTEFTVEEVKKALSAEGFHVNLFQSRQLELLQLPQNLSLFLDAGFNRTKAPAFNTAKELFDRYWDEKRRAVAKRTAGLPDQWTSVIELLSEEMTRTQQLSVPREKLDRFASDYIAQMASEGVLTFDGQRYGFGHESFFDYCFARSFVAKDQSLAEFLIASEQHLFRRAQVRQVLAYLRDADPKRYCRELKTLLTDGRIRCHIKDLALALAMSVPDPSDDEWAVMEPSLESEIAAFEKKEKNPDGFATLIWRHFFASPFWFHFADKKGLIASWLASGNDNLVNMAVGYLRIHQRHAGDRVAELLEPYIGKSGHWPHRFQFIMESAAHESSRRFFELFLRLIDDGTLDNAQDRLASNGTFWLMLHGLAEGQPAWVPEVLAHWLRRRVVLTQQQSTGDEKPNWQDLFNHDNFGGEYFHKAAAKAPAAFVRHVLPVVLEMTDASIWNNEHSPPKRSSVWPMFFESEYESADAACINALVIALETLARNEPTALSEVIAELRQRDTYVANFLLLRLLAAGAAHFANDAVDLLCSQPWRFQCGYSDSAYWVAMELVRAVFPICSEANQKRFVAAILNHSPDYERTHRGYKLAGEARFALLSAVPPEQRTATVQARFEELERKFGKPPTGPREIHCYCVGSPIEKKSAERMSDEQWLKAIAKYDSEERPHRWDHPEKGGAWELAGMLREFVQNEPERFARLSLQCPATTHPTYIQRTLDGLKGTTAPTELKLAVCRKAYAEFREQCGMSIADLLGSIKEPLPEDAVQMLVWIVTEHPDPEKEMWNEASVSGKPHYGGDILNNGINTTRGRGAEAIRDLIFENDEYIGRFSTTLGRLVADRSLSVRACVASTLEAVARHDFPLALRLFTQLVATDDRLLATHHAAHLIYLGLRDHFDVLRPYVERMLRSKDPKVSQIGARLASLAALYHSNAADLATEALAGNPSQRLGVAQVASANIAHAECCVWCEERLTVLFNDADPEVRREAASCFQHLKNEPLEDYKKLIAVFCESAAYQEDSFSVLHVLEDSLNRLPGMTSVVCGKFLQRFGDEARDFRTGRAADVYTVGKLIFRAYHQHQHDEWAPQFLDLIDRLCLEGIHQIMSGLEEFER